MRVRMITRYAGPIGVYQPGAVVSLGAAEAEALIAGGFAESAEPAPVEVATVKAPARAVSKRGRKPARPTAKTQTKK